MPGRQTPAQSAASGRQMSPAQLNMAARNLILRGGNVGGKYQPPAIDVWQPQNPPAPNNPGPGSVLTFYVRNVGLVKRLYVLFKARITTPATSGNALTLTPWGLANFVSNVSFFDLGNNQRINTTGWHLTAIATAKRRGVFGGNFLNDNPFGYGGACASATGAAGGAVNGENVNGIVNNKSVQSAPVSIAANNNHGDIAFVLEIPFVKNDQDLRGAIYADVTQATMQVQVTLNPNMFVPTGADPTLAVYQSANASIPTSLTTFSYQVFQNYLDQLPRVNNVPILPQIDIATAYLLNSSASGLPVANQDNAASFVNSRSYESVVFGYDNNGTLNTDGSDINYILLQSANFTNILNLNGQLINMMGRNVIGDDWPQAMYYLDFRHRPIDTNQYGNMQLVVNPSTVTGSGATILYGWEAYGIIGLVNQGGSIPLGGG